MSAGSAVAASALAQGKRKVEGWSGRGGTEAEALARREAARMRVEARSLPRLVWTVVDEKPSSVSRLASSNVAHEARRSAWW